MLSYLKVENYVLVEEIELFLDDGFTVFTGETGAGKSLFIDALNFISGERSSSDIVGSYADEARVEAVFEIEKEHQVNDLLKEYGLYEEDSLIISRTMNKKGRSQSRINQKTVNQGLVRQITSLILDLHSQHETQYLLKRSNHIELLDRFSKSQELLSSYKETYKLLKIKQLEAENLKKTHLDRESIDFIRFQLSEIQTINPTLEDYENLENKLEFLNNFEKNRKIYAEINEYYSTAMESMFLLKESIEKFDQENLSSDFNDIYFSLEAFEDRVSNIDYDQDFDEEEFNYLNKRSLDYSNLIRKYGNIKSVLKKERELTSTLSQIENFEYYLEKINEEVEIIKVELEKKANVLSKHRKIKARELENKVKKELSSLLLKDAEFRVGFTEKGYSSNGIDDISFLVSLNPGMPLQPLEKVASGGELSRLMLALKIIFSRIYGIETIIFDEIDSGLSGQAAFALGKKMRQLGKEVQVISITHLSNVASFARQHYLISKEVENKQSKTNLKKLDKISRIKELAYMAHGGINDENMLAAKKLYEESQGGS